MQNEDKNVRYMKNEDKLNVLDSISNILVDYNRACFAKNFIDEDVLKIHTKIISVIKKCKKMGVV